MAALIWVIAGALLIAAEVLSGNLVMLMLGVGALIAAISAGVGLPLWIDVIVFGLSSVGLVVLARPVLRRRMGRGELTAKTNAEALVGEKATVVTEVNADGGLVKLAGEVWSARSLDETQVLEEGRIVTVMEISGATAVVWDTP
ncbi:MULTISPECIES: NfeD family protein [Actinoalloteichus]|uniref:Membrane protein implicated in regulation of membrane protease activity n=1 Tax=Actinoalloteichus fjordicus TaxID=1612552 RepID=A0AAC9LAI6_9PSEU|nr:MULTISPECIES: NfeD family protein [Actinoalloteichus]APU14373.1 membrane protein implicated in regulation of membrane protease activity [Actinoalloteichus fjordicus]APU20342.1 membrane protein implicated in regulation of membrane protease activity [Actinoalloteichus sp. GBA129-24]